MLRGAGRLSDVLLKLDWYAKQLDEQNQNGWWARNLAARAQWKAASDEYAQAQAAWEALNRYFAGTAPEHALLYTGSAISTDMRDLTEAVNDFDESFNIESVSLDGLMEEIRAIQTRCASISERVQAAQTHAEDEITKQLNASNEPAVQRLAERLDKLGIMPDPRSVAGARTHQEAHVALDRYQQELAKTGDVLCAGRHELYDKYLQVYSDLKQGLPGDQAIARHGEKLLREMSERNLITLRMTVDL